MELAEYRSLVILTGNNEFVEEKETITKENKMAEREKKENRGGGNK